MADTEASPRDTRSRSMEDTNSNSNSNHVYTLDEALISVGFGKYHGLLLAYGGLGWIAESMGVMILSFIGSALQSEWHLSAGQKSFISTAVFGGMLIGSYFWGVVSDAYGRKKGILGVATVTAVAGLLSAFSPNYFLLIVLRFVSGIGLGGLYIFTSWFLEFVPTPNRGSWMIIFSSFWTLGTISEAGLAWVVMPNFGWRWLIALSSLPTFIVLLFYPMIPESPRFLIMKGQIKEAHTILEQVASLSRTSLPNGSLVHHKMQNHNDNDVERSENSHLLPSGTDKQHNHKPDSSLVFILFSSKLIITNLLLWFLYFGNTFAYYGIILLTSELSSDQNKCGEVKFHSGKDQSDSLYLDVFVTSLAELPGLIISAFIVDRVGRKLSMVVMFILAAILLLPLLIHQSEVLSTALLFGARTFVSATFVVAFIYAPEVYPTNIRATAVGIACAIGKIGGMISPLVAIGLINSCHQAYAVVLFQVTILLSALSIWLSPFETKGKNLDDTLVVEDL